MKIKTDEITSVIKREIEKFGSELEVSEIGQVIEVGDGIARVYGLGKVMAGELVEFDGEDGVVPLATAPDVATGAGGGTNSGSSTTGGWASTRVVTAAGALVTTIEKVGCR